MILSTLEPESWPASEHSYRIRIGSYRVIYNIESAALIIEVVRVAHRRQVYDR